MFYQVFFELIWFSCRAIKQKPQKGAITWPTRKTPFPASAKAPIRELCTTPSPLARAHVREDGAPRSEAALAAWRTKTFGGDFDPVREAVEDAVNAFSDRQREDDRRIWLKIANEIGYEAFRDLYLEQCAIMRECELRNPSATFQNGLNRYTNHSPVGAKEDV